MKEEIRDKLKSIDDEIATLRERLEAVRQTDPYTARWYADRITRLEEKRREIVWENH